MLGSKEIVTLIRPSAPIGPEEFTWRNCATTKIVIMTDRRHGRPHRHLSDFFYRQMPSLIEHGHLFIAQPPLYKVSRGRSEVYLKDDSALDEYLVDVGLDGLILDGPDGQRSGADLRTLVEHARRVRSLMFYVQRKYDPALIEALAINGALEPTLDGEARNVAVAKVAAWLDAADPEAGWTGAVAEEGGYLLKRLWRGVTDAHVIEKGFLVSAEARKLHGLAAEHLPAYAGPSTLRVLKKGAAPAPEAAPEPIAGENAADVSEAAEAAEGSIHTRKTFPLAPRSCSTRCSSRAGGGRSRATRAGEMNPSNCSRRRRPGNRSRAAGRSCPGRCRRRIFTR